MKNFKLVLAAAGLALASSGVNAGIVSVSGSTVNFSFDDSYLSALFGGYSVAGDTLSFSPTTFVAEQNGFGLTIQNATTPLITISAKSGYLLSELELFEQGDYFRIQDSSDATVVSVSGQFIVNNNPTSIASTQDPLSTTISADGLMKGTEKFKTTTWTAEKSVALTKTESATAKIENILLAGALDGWNQAFIEKKLINLSAETVAVPAQVPVPGAVWLFGSALFGIVISRRSKPAA